MSKYLDPKSDLVFKRIFGDHPHLLMHFLNSVLPLPEDGLIESLTYLTPEQVPVIPVLKRTIVDVKCRDQKGRYFIVEMQLEWATGFMQRMLFNASQAYVKQLGKGEQYHTLCPVYGLGIINDVFDHATEEWYHHYQIVNVENPKRQLEGLEFVFLELPKFKVSSREDKKLRSLWLRFLSELDEKHPQVSPDLLSVPEIDEAVSLAEEAAYTSAELEWYNLYWDTISTEKTLLDGKYAEGLAEGLAEGRAEGCAEGRAEAVLDMARQMKKAGLSRELISQLTGLSQSDIDRV